MRASLFNLLVVGLLGLSLTCNVQAERYRLPAYITNLWFSPKPPLEAQDGSAAEVLNQLQAEDAEVSAYLMMDLLLAAGEHHLQVEILDSEGALFDRLSFERVAAAQDDWRFSASGRFGGGLPDGGVFLKVYDSLDGRGKELIGTFRLLTGRW